MILQEWKSTKHLLKMNKIKNSRLWSFLHLLYTHICFKQSCLILSKFVSFLAQRQMMKKTLTMVEFCFEVLYRNIFFTRFCFLFNNFGTYFTIFHLRIHSLCFFQFHSSAWITNFTTRKILSLISSLVFSVRQIP